MARTRITLAEIGRTINRSRITLHGTITGKNRSKLCRQAISDALGLPVSIWEEMDREIRARKNREKAA